jgi:hypothetical protein
LRLRGIDRQRLLAQDRFARRRRRERPLRMKVVRQRIVDRVDVGVGEQCGVIVVHPWDTEARGDFSRARGVAARDRGDDAVARRIRSRNEAFHADVRRAQDAPSNALRHQ